MTIKQTVDICGRQRVRIFIDGVVQGVGFRPFIYRLAQELHLKGWVCNSPAGLSIEAEGTSGDLGVFLRRIRSQKPAHSLIRNFQYVFSDPCGGTDFEIRSSGTSSRKRTLVLPDMATCPECLKEIFDPLDRRYLYPFTNCTHCGPRYSIIEAIPYDRANTTMKNFRMCDECRREYEDPVNRRFHAQPNACGKCGPHLELWDGQGNVTGREHETITGAAAALKEGKIAAVKGIGGFHLFADASNEASIHLLRKRKRREEKPFALMFPSLEMVKEYCFVSVQEEFLLTSREAPIVLLRARLTERSERKSLPELTPPLLGGAQKLITSSVAPGNPYLGVMLPYSPLHHILMRELQIPVVATSGNLAEEPISMDEQEAIERLAGIADVFLVHNRPIARSIDDSVVRIVMNRPIMQRRARGYAPLPVSLKEEGPSVLAVGGHLKNTVALSVEDDVFVSQHIGDLQTEKSFEAFRRAAESLKGLYEPGIKAVVCDRHPDYLSSQFARETGLALISVQHHHAHIVSCMAENHLDETVLGIAWDGTGFGEDGTIWGGEFLICNLEGFTRAGHLRTFFLPGGEKAVREPVRAAVGLLHEVFGERLWEYKDLPPLTCLQQGEVKILTQMIAKNIHSPRTSSAGRLFDAAASILGLVQVNCFEGQAAMTLEYILPEIPAGGRYHYRLTKTSQGCLIADWGAMIEEMIADLRSDIPAGEISAKFHHTLVDIAVDIAGRVGRPKVVLSGGCFQNKYLTEKLILRLREEGFNPYWHQWVPPNDGGISLGQAVVGMSRLKIKSSKDKLKREICA